MRKSAQSAKIFGTPPERGHSCPQQLPNTQQDRNVRELYFRSTLLRTRMSALRFGSGSAGLGTDAPYHSENSWVLDPWWGSDQTRRMKRRQFLKSMAFTGAAGRILPRTKLFGADAPSNRLNI